MLLGIVIGVVFMVCLILSFMAGYGMADQKYKSSEEE